LVLLLYFLTSMRPRKYVRKNCVGMTLEYIFLYQMKFIVPNTSAGMVIGKNGTSIKEIRETTTANIQIYPKAGTEEAKMSLERVITIGHETNDVLMSAMQKVLERVCADPLHSQPITSESQNVRFKNLNVNNQ